MEKQKNTLLSEEVKIKKGTVERLRSELENTKEQLEYMKEEKGKNYILCPVLLGYWVKDVCSHMVPEHWCWGTTQNSCVQTLSTPKFQAPLSAQVQGRGILAGCRHCARILV